MFGCEFRCHGYQWRTAPWCGAFSWTVSHFTSWASSVLASWGLTALFCTIIWTYIKLFLLDKSILSTYFVLCSPYLAGWLTVITFCRSITYTKRGWIQLVSFLTLLSQMLSINQRFVLCDDIYEWFSVIGIVLHTVQCYLWLCIHRPHLHTYKCYRGEEWLGEVLFMIKCPWWFVLRHVLYCTDHECIVCLVEMGFRLRNHYRSMVGGLSTMRHIVALVLVLKLWVLYPVICCCWILWSCEFLLICVSFLFINLFLLFYSDSVLSWMRLKANCKVDRVWMVNRLVWDGWVQADDECCNSCEEVREAYRKKGWAVTNPDLIDQVDLDFFRHMSFSPNQGSHLPCKWF